MRLAYIVDFLKSKIGNTCIKCLKMTQYINYLKSIKGKVLSDKGSCYKSFMVLNFDLCLQLTKKTAHV